MEIKNETVKQYDMVTGEFVGYLITLYKLRSFLAVKGIAAYSNSENSEG